MIVPLRLAPMVRDETLRLIRHYFGSDPPSLGRIFVKVVDKGWILVGTYTLEDDDLPGSGLPGPWVADLVVKPEFRGKGFGKELLEDAKSRTDKPLFAWCETPMYWNLFRKSGFHFVCSMKEKNCVTDVAVFAY